MSKYEKLKECFPKEVLYEFLWEDNLTFRELQTKFGYSERLFSTLSKEYKIPKNNSAIRKNSNLYHKVNLKYETIKTLYWDSKLSTRQIADYFKCQHSTVAKFMRDNNIPIRDAHDKIYYTNRIKAYSKYNNLDSTGYVLISINGEQIREHRYIMEQFLQRKLNSEETVHHIDFDKTNNDIENLYLFKTNAMHQIYHGYISNHSFIAPDDFVVKFEEPVINLFKYNNLYDKYITQRMSCSDIVNEFNNKYKLNLSRNTISYYLKDYKIFYLRKPQVNQYE